MGPHFVPNLTCTWSEMVTLFFQNLSSKASNISTVLRGQTMLLDSKKLFKSAIHEVSLRSLATL